MMSRTSRTGGVTGFMLVLLLTGVSGAQEAAPPLTLEESMAIRWHMGLADTDYSTRCALNQAMQIYPLIAAVQMADMAATYWEGK